MRPLRIAIVGAGMGGLTATALLTADGHDVQLFEQARQFTRLGAGIQQSANAVRVLRAMGLEPRLREVAYRPGVTRYRDGITGELQWEKHQGDEAERAYGAPHMLLHRGDLHDMLASKVKPGQLHLNHKLERFVETSTGVTLYFENGAIHEADILIGADGVHSRVRDQLFGPSAPRYTGRVAYRTTFATARIGMEIEESTKWIGPDRHIVIYYLNPRRDEVYFVTSTPEPNYSIESWSSVGDLDELRAAYRDFHPQVRAVLDACPAVHKWALVERDPMPSWGTDRVVLLGDACHPMTPYMAQGAATSMEDGAVLARCLAGVAPDDTGPALKRYEATRKPRTSLIQEASSLNSVDRIRSEVGRVYGYDAFIAPLADTAAAEPVA